MGPLCLYVMAKNTAHGRPGWGSMGNILLRGLADGGAGAAAEQVGLGALGNR